MWAPVDSYCEEAFEVSGLQPAELLEAKSPKHRPAGAAGVDRGEEIKEKNYET